MFIGKLWLKIKRWLHIISDTEYRQGKIKYLPHINKVDYSYKITNFNHMGTVESKRSPKLVVSLTSFPERMYDIHFTIYSLLNQSIKPDKVVLWLAEDQFPNKEKDIPETVLKLINNGLTIKWCSDLRSYKKLIPSLEEYSQDIIVTADDDIFYPQTWLELLYTAYLKKPQAIHCHRGHQLRFSKQGEILPYKKWKHRISNISPSFYNFFTGAGGVLYPPHSLYKDVSDIALFQKLAPNADDIWFWAMAVLAGTKINVVKGNFRDLIYINPERELKLTSEFTLAMVNTATNQNDFQLKQIMEYYPQLINVLNSN
ncbi:MAG: glycosyltransferase family 2 protein [Alphaproteobacteria bacterium]|nr:glycosyltransferase family 2 protein [Alphaproteobacteria bacterium]